MPSWTDNNNEAKKLQEVMGRVLTPGRLVTHCLVQFGAYLAVNNLMEIYLGKRLNPPFRPLYVFRNYRYFLYVGYISDSISDSIFSYSVTITYGQK